MLICILITLKPASGSPEFIETLQRAIKSSQNTDIKILSTMFKKALHQATSLRGQTNVLKFWADALFERKAFDEAVIIYKKMCDTGEMYDCFHAYYFSIQACLLSNQSDKAQILKTQVKKRFNNKAFAEYLNCMKKIEGNEIYAYTVDFIEKADYRLQPVPTVSDSNVSDFVTATTTKMVTDKPDSAFDETAKKQDAHMGYEPADLSLAAQLDNLTLKGTIIARGMHLNLSKDTELKSSTRPGFSGNWHLSDSLQLNFNYLEFVSKSHLTKPVIYDGAKYDPSSEVDFETSVVDIGATKTLAQSSSVLWQILGGVKLEDLFFKLTQNSAAGIISGDLKQSFTIPYFGLSNKTRISANLSMVSSIKYLLLNKHGNTSKMSDFNLGLYYHLNPNRKQSKEWYGILGYRYFNNFASADGDSSEISFNVTSIGIENRF